MSCMSFMKTKQHIGLVFDKDSIGSYNSIVEVKL